MWIYTQYFLFPSLCIDIGLVKKFRFSVFTYICGVDIASIHNLSYIY